MMNLGEWIGAGAELLVAFVILWELEEHRRSSFHDEAADSESYEARGEVYEEFFQTKANSIAEKSEAFCAQLWKEKWLKRRCEEHIVPFSRLGQIRRYSLFFKTDYLELFPHTVVLFWIMLEPYITVRRRLTGKWWATDFMKLTFDCLGFLLKDPDATLSFYDSDRTKANDIVITRTELVRLKEGLANELARFWWL